MNTSYESLKQLVEIDSPTGYTHNAEAFVMQFLQQQGLQPKQTNKGAVKLAFGENPTIALAAHLDTLGGIVSGIKSNGTLTISPIGGLGLIS